MGMLGNVSPCFLKEREEEDVLVADVAICGLASAFEELEREGWSHIFARGERIARKLN
jgi:hypothetical protein